MQKSRNWMLKNIIFLGLVSFFADISSEMVYPLIPLYLTAAFGATPVLVGIVEGIAESIASLLKVYSGYISDRYNRKKPLAFLGMPPVCCTSWHCCLPAPGLAFWGRG